MEYIILALLIIVNGVFSMYEIALVSSRKTRLQERADNGAKGARIALDQLQHIEKFVSTIQIAITLAGILAGAYGGVQLSGKLLPYLSGLPFTPEVTARITVTLAVILVTYLTLVFGETVPKSIAFRKPESITIFLAPFMKLVAILFHPLVWILSLSTQGVLKVFGMKNYIEPYITEEELKLMIRQSSESGVIDKQESEIIKDVFRFGNKTAFSIMTTRPDIRWIDIRMPKEEVLEVISDAGYSKYPVCDGSLDDIRGILVVKNLLGLIRTDQPEYLLSILSDPIYVPENMPAVDVLEKFREQKNHIAIVVDEYGSVEGLITLHDLVEHILGDLPDLTDNEPPDYEFQDDGSYTVSGSMNFWELAELLNFPELDNEEFEEEARNFSTVGGLAMYELESIPQPGDQFSFGGFDFTVTGMDKNRVTSLVVKPAVSDILPDTPDLDESY